MRRLESTWLAQLQHRGDGVSHGPVLVACSGGGDSVALLAFLWAMRASLGLELIVAHADHGLREGAQEDAESVRTLCRRLDLDLVEARLDVKSHAALTRQGLETAARELRWAWLRTEAASCGALAVATGHTLDDHTETVFLRMLRNGGTGALAPLPARQGIRWSPLIEARRADLRTYLTQLGLSWREDPTNSEGFTPRNRLRPYLEKLREEAPCLDAHLWETHRQVSELMALRDESLEAWRGSWWELEEPGIRLSPAVPASALRLILAMALPRLGLEATAHQIADLASWAAPRLNLRSKKPKTWGGWQLQPWNENWRMLIPPPASKKEDEAPDQRGTLGDS